ncbi:MAG: hypothetical protein JW888_07280 [Pirellulales bacterium]|nr:hypothetical protein [Pirellulales bacterium]
MKKTRSLRGRRRSTPPPIPWLCVAVATFLLVSTLGCAGNPRLEQLHKGTSCSAENVQRYAAEHNLTYDQALDEIRRQDQQLWTEEEARQAKLQRHATKPTAAKAPASIGWAQLSEYRQCKF